MLGLSPPEIAAALAIVFVAAVLQGAAGLGFALVSSPLLALIDPTLAPQVVLGTGSLLSITFLALGGNFDALAAARNLLLLPAVLFGFALSTRFIALLDRNPIRPVILTVCAVSALMVIVRTMGA